MTTRNEAAERLLEQALSIWDEDPGKGYELGEQALAAERRATVERIRESLLAELPAPMADGDEILWSTVIDILDEEAK